MIDDVLQFQDKNGNEVELSQVKIGSFDIQHLGICMLEFMDKTYFTPSH